MTLPQFYVYIGGFLPYFHTITFSYNVPFQNLFIK
jgi:hypothetical protein